MRRMNSDHLFYKWHPFIKQQNVITSTAMIRGLVGANRVGKTETIAYVAVSAAHGFNPVLTRLTGRIVLHHTPANIWAVSLDRKVSSEVLEAKIARFIPPGAAEWRTRDLSWHFHGTGSKITFKSCDSGWEKFQGAEIDLVVFDEEPDDERIFNECFMRILSVSGKMVFSFTATRGSLWLHDVLFDPEEAGIEPKHVFTQQIGMVDNPYLPKGTVEKARLKYPGDEGRIRVDGEYLLSMGNRFFDQEKVLFHKQHRKKPVVVGTLERDPLRGVYRPRNTGLLDAPLWVIAFPEPGKEYAIGVDVGSGDPLGDWNVAIVLDALTLEEVCVYRNRHDPTEFGSELYDLGSWYNDALIGVETNRSGGATLSSLKGLSYPRLYAMPEYLKTPRVRRKADGSFDGQQQHLSPPKFGWNTSGRTKPVAMNNFRHLLNQDSCRFHNTTLMAEMLKFAHLKEGFGHSNLYGLGALKGHDDHVMAFAIALMVAKDMHVEPPRKKQAFQDETIEDLILKMSFNRQLRREVTGEEEEDYYENFTDLLD